MLCCCGSVSAPTRRGATHQRAGTCHDATGVVRHDQLTNAALAVWFGAFEEPPHMSSERDTCLRRAEDAKQRAAQASEPSIKSAYEKAAEYFCPHVNPSTRRCASSGRTARSEEHTSEL